VNAIRPVLLLIVLGGIGYAVYARLNAKPDAPPPGIAENWNDGLQIEMPGESAAAPADRTSAAPGGAPPTWNNPSGSANANPTANSTAAPRFPANTTAEIAATPEVKSAESPNSLPPLQPDLSTRGAGADQAPPFGTGNAELPGNLSAPPDLQKPGADANATTGMDPRQFDVILQAIQQELDADQLTEALLQLTKLADEAGLTPLQQQQITTLLDQLAGTVIYSTRSIVLPPHEVKPGETLETIAGELQIPWQLLAKINGIDDPNAVQPGERLKVIRGPFHAMIDLQKREMSLRIGGMYAGRFAIGTGPDTPPEGTYSVTEKITDPVYHGDSRSLAAGDPANPLGKCWIGLGDRFGIHGSPANSAADLQRPDVPGSIALQSRDAEDAFDILTVGSRVTVRR
jgi:LysM repeat protein